MKQNVTFSDFIDAFRGRGNQFTYDGLALLFDYLESYEQDTGEDLELDVVALCCDYAESTAAELIDQYDIFENGEPEDEDEVKAAIIEYLENETAFLGVTDSGSFVYAQF